MGRLKGGKQFQLKKADIIAMRDARVEAVQAEYPYADHHRVVELVNLWYRGKPGTGRIGTCISKAGLL